MYKILIVEDSQENIDVLSGALSEQYKMFAVKNSTKTVEVARKIQPDIILLDIMMPHLDGYAVIQLLKSDQYLKDIPVIFITALTSLKEKTMGFELGAVDYIVKPFDIGEVNARVSTHLSLMQTRRDLRETLSKTLVGSIQVFLEFEKKSNELTYKLSLSAKKNAHEMAVALGYKDLWKVDTATLLSLAGLVYLKPESLDAILRGTTTSHKDIEYYNSFSQSSADMINKIPRLEDVAEMVSLMQKPLGRYAFDPNNSIMAGAQIIKAAYRYEVSRHKNLQTEFIIKQMKLEKENYPGEVIEALEWVVGKENAGR